MGKIRKSQTAPGTPSFALLFVDLIYVTTGRRCWWFTDPTDVMKLFSNNE